MFNHILQKNPRYEKVRHKILSFLDSKASEAIETSPVITKSNEEKDIKNSKITSVLSNVKNKALSFIKTNDKTKSISDSLFKKTDSYLKTPPSSIPTSPLNQRRASTDTNLSYTIIKSTPTKNKISKQKLKVEQNKHRKKYISESDDVDSIDEIYNEKRNSKQKNPIDTLINSPIKRPATVNGQYISSNKASNYDINLMRSQSTTGLLDIRSEDKAEIVTFTEVNTFEGNEQDNTETSSKTNIKKFLSDNNVFHINQSNTKSVLKNAPSTSSLSKKKVIFDLDANQTKSVSASPSQSNTEKSDMNIENMLESINLEEEWDISR